MDGAAKPAHDIPALDGLRAFAIALVLARHAAAPFADAPIASIGGYDVFSPLINGWLGVDLFFALSGYLVGRRAFVALQDGAFSWRGYARGRIMRIAPAYFVTVFFALAFAALFYHRNIAELSLSALRHALFMQDIGGSDLLTPLWSLGVEAKFYLAAPVIAALALRLGPAPIIVLALLPLLARALIWSGMDQGLDYPAFFLALRSPIYACCDALALGLFVAWLLHRRGAPHRARHARLAWTIGAGAFALLLAAPPWLASIEAFDAVFLQSFAGIAVAALVYAVAAGAGPQACLSAAPLRWLARHAYGLYLVHWFTVPFALAIANGANGPALARMMAYLPIYLGASLILAMALHRFVEFPFLRARPRAPALAY